MGEHYSPPTIKDSNQLCSCISQSYDDMMWLEHFIQSFDVWRTVWKTNLPCSTIRHSRTRRGTHASRRYATIIPPRLSVIVGWPRSCSYSGASGHVIASCPVGPPCALVSYITCPKVISSPLTTIMTLTAILCPFLSQLSSTLGQSTTLSLELCHQLKLEKRTSQATYQVQSIIGKTLSGKPFAIV